MTETTLQAQALTKRFGDTLALDALDLSVGAGEIVCLLGANGAGKTTTINLFLGFTEPTSGSALVCGMDVQADPAAAREALGIAVSVKTLFDNRYFTGGDFRSVFFGEARQAQLTLSADF
ncbi:MAG: ATP-binding cassette domain-containing protein [Sphingopyxis sp.]|nr:ATP-binding cassette domain-containing protein [Sphingopyxis sp.]